MAANPNPVNEGTERLTVGALRDFLTAMDGAPLADDQPVMVHVGWDWPVEEMDASDGLLVLLAEIPEGVSFVNFDGLQAMEKSSTEAHRKAMLLETKNDRQAEIIASMRDKAEQWDAAQPLIAAMSTVCTEATRICMEKGHGDTAMWDALDALAKVADG